MCFFANVLCCFYFTVSHLIVIGFYFQPYLVDTCLRKQPFGSHVSAMFFQFSCSLLQLGVENDGGRYQDDDQDPHDDKERGAGRVGDREALAGEHPVVLVASHAVFRLLRPTLALTVV